MHMVRYFIPSITVTLLHITSYAQAPIKDAHLAWENGKAHVPGLFFSRAPDKVELTQKLPVVILMHGCTGINGEINSWASFIKNLGYIVILPDSFARKGRLQNCNPQTRATGAFPYAIDYRQEEISYALDKLKSYPWVDADNIYLMGHSEGGHAAAMAPQEEFKGKIITGWSCRTGVAGPRSTPILAIVYLQDSWYGKFNAGGCGESTSQFESYTFLGFKGEYHDVYHRSEARDAVKKFLNRQ